MAYTFVNQDTATAKISGDTSGDGMTLSSVVNGKASADNVVMAIKGLYFLGNKLSEFEATEITRTVKQNVNSN